VVLPFYYRYVDDIVLALPSIHFNHTVEVFNSFHNRLQFSIEISNNNVFNFLDVSLIVQDGRFAFDLVS